MRHDICPAGGLPADRRPHARLGLLRLLHALGRAWRRLAWWIERARQRRRLLELDERLLRDIGLSRAAAWAEADKPFWQA